MATRPVLVSTKPAATEHPLIIAIVYNRNPEVALSLIQSGADCNATDSIHHTPALYYAASSPFCQIDIVRALVEHGAKLNTPGIGGSRPLHGACFAGCCPDVVKYLISKGADVSAREQVNGDTPLHVAACCGDGFSENPAQIVRILIAHGADVNAIDSEGKTPLDFAIEFRKTSRIVLLREHGGKSGKEIVAPVR